MDAVRARQLRECLDRIPQRVVKDAYERINGDGSKLAGAIRRVVQAAARRPRDALARWKNYL